MGDTDRAMQWRCWGDGDSKKAGGAGEGKAVLELHLLGTE